MKHCIRTKFWEEKRVFRKYSKIMSLKWKYIIGNEFHNILEPYTIWDDAALNTD